MSGRSHGSRLLAAARATASVRDNNPFAQFAFDPQQGGSRKRPRDDIDDVIQRRQDSKAWEPSADIGISRRARLADQSLLQRPNDLTADWLLRCAVAGKVARVGSRAGSQHKSNAAEDEAARVGAEKATAAVAAAAREKAAAAARETAAAAARETAAAAAREKAAAKAKAEKVAAERAAAERAERAAADLARRAREDETRAKLEAVARQQAARRQEAAAAAGRQEAAEVARRRAAEQAARKKTEAAAARHQAAAEAARQATAQREAAERKRSAAAADQQRLFAEARARMHASSGAPHRRGHHAATAQPLPATSSLSELPASLDALIAAIQSAKACPYRCLRLPAGAPREQVRRRHRDLCLRLHPDKAGGHPGAAEAFCAVQTALREGFPHAV